MGGGAWESIQICFQLYIDFYKCKLSCKPHGNHKAKTYSRYTNAEKEL